MMATTTSMPTMTPGDEPNDPDTPREEPPMPPSRDGETDLEAVITVAGGELGAMRSIRSATDAPLLVPPLVTGTSVLLENNSRPCVPVSLAVRASADATTAAHSYLAKKSMRCSTKENNDKNSDTQQLTNLGSNSGLGSPGAASQCQWSRESLRLASGSASVILVLLYYRSVDYVM